MITDKQMAIQMLNGFTVTLEDLSIELRSDKEVVLAAIQSQSFIGIQIQRIMVYMNNIKEK